MRLQTFVLTGVCDNFLCNYSKSIYLSIDIWWLFARYCRNISTVMTVVHCPSECVTGLRVFFTSSHDRRVKSVRWKVSTRSSRSRDRLLKLHSCWPMKRLNHRRFSEREKDREREIHWSDVLQRCGASKLLPGCRTDTPHTGTLYKLCSCQVEDTSCSALGNESL